MMRKVIAIGTVVAAGVLASASACRAPTQITIHVVPKNLSCSSVTANPLDPSALTSVSIDTGGGDTARLEMSGPCVDGAELGSVAIIPGASDSVTISVIGALGGAACPVGSESSGTCIVAKRRLSFVKSFDLELTVELDGLCSGVNCPDPLVCQAGKCVPVGCGTGGAPCPSDAGPPVDGAPPRVAVTGLSVGGDSACVTTTGDVYCWGDSPRGKLFAKGPIVPTPIPQLHGAENIVLGEGHGCAIFPANGGTTVKCWGANDSGQAGDDSATTVVTTPTEVLTTAKTPLTKVTSLSAGAEFTCALNGDAVFCWGKNDRRQLGVDGLKFSARAVAIVGPVAPNAVACGHDHACISSVGEQPCTDVKVCNVMCWGANTAGQCTLDGDPVAPRGVGVSAPKIVAGGNRTIVFDPAATSFTYWGAAVGQALPQTKQPRTPNVVSPTAVSQMSTGLSHACALGSKGKVGCYGWSITNALVYGELRSGNNHACGITTAGTVFCWGSQNAQGQLGSANADLKSANLVPLPL